MTEHTLSIQQYRFCTGHLNAGIWNVIFVNISYLV